MLFDPTCGVFRVAGSLGFGGKKMATLMARTTVAVFLFLAVSGYVSALYGPSSDVVELTSTNFKNKVLSQCLSNRECRNLFVRDLVTSYSDPSVFSPMSF